MQSSIVALLDAPENEIHPLAFCYTTKSAADLKPALDKMENEAILQIIKGDKPLSYFDTFVSNWKKAGGDTLTKEVQALVK